jgi:DNA-binding NtrC family response regulator
VSGGGGQSTQGLGTRGGGEVRPLWVEAAEGPSAGARCELVAGSITIGSSGQCDLVLRDPTVSRAHATFELLAGAARVRDLGSRNGTVYLGARIREAIVPAGGSVQVGNTVLRLREAAEPVRPSDHTELAGVLGSSIAMRRILAQLERLAAADLPVLVVGETGTGKELVARALHALSPRAHGPWVVLDCAAASGALFESELFGHVRGAFTGAHKERAGALERAHGGTLVLDEVGELPAELQPKLLRALEHKEVQRLGDGRRRAVDLRFIALSRKDLEAEVRAGRFREDLYFRLAATALWIPPLRDRPEDIPLLARHFAAQSSGVDPELSAATLAAFQCDRWPGNVRELRNAVERALAMLPGNEAGRSESAEEPSFHAARDRLLERFEHDYLKALLRRCEGNVSAAARKARISRRQLYRLLEKHGLVGGG